MPGALPRDCRAAARSISGCWQTHLGGGEVKAVVIGAGPGGLTTTIALRRAGIDATVFDRAEDLSQLHVGSGVHIWPNGMRGLRRIDEELFESMRAVGAREEKLEIRRG